jgi:hypothetical protein
MLPRLSGNTTMHATNVACTGHGRIHSTQPLPSNPTQAPGTHILTHVCQPSWDVPNGMECTDCVSMPQCVLSPALRPSHCAAAACCVPAPPQTVLPALHTGCPLGSHRGPQCAPGPPAAAAAAAAAGGRRQQEAAGGSGQQQQWQQQQQEAGGGGAGVRWCC